MGAELKDTEQSCSALKGAELLATADGNARRRDGQNVGEAGSGGSGAQQDKVGRDAFRRAPRDDAVVLGKVGDENAEQEDSATLLLSKLTSGSEGCGWKGIHGNDELKVRGRLQLLATVIGGGKDVHACG